MCTLQHKGNQPGLCLETNGDVWFGLLTDEVMTLHNKKNTKLAEIERSKWKVLKHVPNHRYLYQILNMPSSEWCQIHIMMDTAHYCTN